MSKPHMTNPVIFPRRKLSGVPDLLARSFCCLAGAILLLGLAACAQAPKQVEKKEEVVLVYPSPPDDPRFYFERAIHSSRDVDTSVAGNSLEDLLTGKNSSATDTPMRKPYAVAAHKGRIFVSEPSSRIVRVFDLAQDKYFTIGDEDPGALGMPIGLDVDGEGNLYVADSSIQSVMVYNRDGKFLRKLAGTKMGEAPLFTRLSSVTVDNKGQRLYAVDIGGTSSTPEFHRVRVFDIQTGNHLFDIGKRGTGPGEFNLPRDAVLDKNNNLYVVDGGNFRVQVFDYDGKFLREFGKLGTHIGGFSRPKEIALDSAGNIYVIDTGFANFQIFDPEGKLLMFIGGGGSLKDVPGRYRLLSGIAIDDDDRIYVVDQVFRKVEVFRPASLAEGEGYAGGKKAVAGKPQQGNVPASKPPAQTIPAKGIPEVPAGESESKGAELDELP